MTEFTFAIQQLIEAGDWETLASILRNTRKSPDLRKQAALALAEIQAPEGGEALLEAIFKDPSQEVRDAAFEALKDLVGSETSQLAMESYGEEPAPLGEASEEEASGEEDEDLGDVRWDATDVVGLSNIISAENDPQRRIKAVRAMGTIAHMDAVNYLVYVALWEEDDSVRKAAYDALRERYGDDLDNFLAEERKAQLASEGMTEEDIVELEDEEMEEDAPVVLGSQAASLQYPSPSRMAPSSPVIQEENPGKGFLLALVGVVVLVLILYLLFFA
ncbi:MAG: HEAT repeat domain-containing protein [Anaerolineaceae bacterium]|nr:HEAT repeat domain-containing protein [Anaerolineaceae bacterium]